MTSARRHAPRLGDRPCRVTPLGLVAAMGCALLLSACGQPETDVQVEVDAYPGEDLSTLTALRVTVRAACAQPEHWGPYSLADNERYYLRAEVEPDTPFFVDVKGCNNSTTCEPIVARGCTLSDGVPEGEKEVLTVLLRQFDADNDPCPPALPTNTCPPPN